MKAFLAIAGGGLLLGGIHASGVFQSGDVYAKPFDLAYAELAATPIPPMIASAFPGTTTRIVRNCASIEWHFVTDAGDSAVFIANLSSEDAGHTRVTTDARVGKALDPQVHRLLATPFMINIARVGMAEQVAAELDDRPFNKLRFGQLLSAYLTAHPADLQNYGQEIRNIMNDIATQVNGYPSKANGTGSVRDALGGFDSVSRSMNAKVIRDATTPSTPEQLAPFDPPTTPRDATVPTTDLSKYR